MVAGMIRVYVYEKCSTCRKALKWLGDRGIDHEVVAIRETPPTEEELAAMLGHLGGALRKLFNTSGMDYRAQGLKDRLPGMAQEEAFALLRSNGMLVKRPFLIGGDLGLVGFREAQWQEALGGGGRRA